MEESFKRKKGRNFVGGRKEINIFEGKEGSLTAYKFLCNLVGEFYL